MRNSCSWKPGLTKTFRNRSSLIFNRWGSPLQNPSDDICRIYTASAPHRRLIQCDLAGAEALDVAMRTPPGSNFRKLFKNNIKPHTFVAMHLFATQWCSETPYDAQFLRTLDIDNLPANPQWGPLSKIIKNNYERYFIGKKCCHSFNYGKREGTFRFDVLKESEGKVVLSLQDSKEFRTMYISLFPEIFFYWHEEVKKALLDNRIIYNSLGYPHYFGGHVNIDKTIREAIATGPQSTVGCIANIAAERFQTYIEEEGKNWDLLNNKHDSLLAESDDSESMECARVLAGCMSGVRLVSPFDEEFFMKVEAAIGENWAKNDGICIHCTKDEKGCKCGNYETSNPKGLKEISFAV